MFLTSLNYFSDARKPCGSMFFLESCVTRHTPCDTDHGWNSHGSKCYKKIDTTNGWRGARHDCLWEGGDLVSITSEEEEKFVKEQMGDKPFWIGLSNLVCDKDHCKLFEEGQKRLTWSDTGVTPTYANWTSNQGGSSDNESCAYVNQGVHEGSQPGKWRHGSCGSSLAYMCERSPDDCPDGWPCSYKDLGYTYSRVETSYCDSGEFLYNDSCYHFEGRFENWQEAEDLCKEEGGLLASVHSKVDGLFLSAHRRIGSYSWLGLKKNNGKFEWRDGSSTVDVPWYLPKYSSDCTKLNNDGEIEIDNCIDFRPSICQKGKARASLLLLSASASGSTDHEATCDTDNGWSPHGSNCYKKMETSNGWLGARHDCLWEGGDLVSITSEDEEKFVKEQMGDKPFWIGLSNLDCNEVWCQFFKAGEKRLTWSDTAMTPTYANWTSSQDGSSNDESCTYVRQGVHVDSQPGKWRHGSCGSSLAYMCERPLDACPLGRLCSYKDYGFSYSRAETSSCDTGDFLCRDSCFHFEGMKRTWEAAEVFCREWNGHLASVHSLVEGQFLAAHAPYAGGVQSWVGLKKNKDYFEWSDATPTGNIVWVPNGPKGRGGCSALSPTGQLEDWPCTKSQPFICRKAMVQEFVVPPPAGWSAKCGWWLDRSSDDLCYLIQHKPTKTWQKARDDCLLRGGDLLSIADSNEQTVIQGLYTSLSSAPALWLGVNNDITKDGSEWTDRSPFGYMFMDRDDPGDLSGASCLSLLTRNGRWKFDDCRKKRGYICKKRGIPAKPQQPLHALTHHEPTCDTVNGWSPHGSNCYKKMETPNGWLGARHNCLWEGGDLVSITSEDEEMFVMEQMGNKPFWIGLSNLNCNETWCQFFKAGEKSVTWSYTSVTPTYANWDPRQDQSSDDESCVYVNQGVHGDSQPSKWRRGSCRSSLAYMCERSPDDCPDGWPCSYKDLGYTYSRVETSYCDSNEFLYKDSCYHFEVTPKTWQAAEDFCKEKRGFLASVHSPVDRRFLAAHVREGFQPWLGLKKSSAKFEWLDGSCTENVTKNLTQNSDDCAKLNENGGIQLEGCTDLRPSICQKGKARASLPLLPASASASGKSAKCGWWQENPANDLCYLINSKPTKTWKEARDECARLRGNLLAITDSNEHTFIRGLLPSGSSLWLDASDIIVEVGSKQSDESSPSSVLLGASNPGDPPGRRCNSLLSGKGGIEVVDCEKKRGYVCKRRVVQTCERTKGWRRFGSNCYKKMETTNGWLGARYDCVWEGGDLVSITSTYEESFVKEQMGDKPFWIGRSNLNCDVAWCQFFEAGEKRLSLSDTGVTPTYANWDSRQDRSSSDHESCAYVNQGVHVESQPGKWRHGSCGSSLAYMCERPLDACPDGRLCSYKDYAFGYNRVETSSCDTGNFLYKDSCYHFERMKQTWEGAERFCGKWNGHLASVLSWDEGKFLAAHAPSVRGLQSWVGLKKNKDNFEWSDATPTGNIVWVPNGPKGRGGCSSLSPTGQLEDWPCTESQPFICKKAMVQEFVLPPPAGWSGKCGWWLDRSSDDFCYLIQRRPTKTWQKARDDCLLRGGDLLSITDSHEQAFIQSLYTFLPSAPSLWLGVNNNITKDGSEWTDGSPFGYVLMDGDDPGDLSGASCLSLLTRNGRWKFDDCRKKRGYICKKRGKTPKPSKPHDSFKEILVCNNRSADLVCEGEGQNQSRISIQSAFYGRRSDDVCSEDSDSYDDEYCAVEGILPRYRKMCNGHQKCHIELLEDDSCPATSKYLEMVYSCEHKVCLDSLGIADGSLADSFFKASSSMEDTTPEKARLNGESCWKPSKDPVGSWIQVNLGHKRKVTAIVTQGCDSHNTRSWDIQLEMKVSVDRRKWTKHPNGKFIGGGTHLLETPAFAQYVRILPLENRPEFGLRLDILGCAHDDAMTCARRFNSLHLTDSMTFYCPPGCAKHVVFGTLVYSESSHICAAAIHAGVIQNNIGGDCIVMRAPKQQVYTGSTGNGIISRHLDDPLGVSYTFADGEPRCSAPDWEEFAGFCYKPFDDERDWADGQQVCRGFGAELVSIRTKVEQAWVKNASNFETSDMWTGLNDLALPGMFVWSDRHKVTFTPWAAGEPNQRVALGKHCVALLRQTGKWKLMSCTQVNSFMCKMPTVRFPIT
nr:secretory phospholipase A2 receptor isoform X14 [Syngnathus scovelli]